MQRDSIRLYKRRVDDDIDAAAVIRSYLNGVDVRDHLSDHGVKGCAFAIGRAHIKERTNKNREKVILLEDDPTVQKCATISVTPISPSFEILYVKIQASSIQAGECQGDLGDVTTIRCGMGKCIWVYSRVKCCYLPYVHAWKILAGTRSEDMVPTFELVSQPGQNQIPTVCSYTGCAEGGLIAAVIDDLDKPPIVENWIEKMRLRGVNINCSTTSIYYCVYFDWV